MEFYWFLFLKTANSSCYSLSEEFVVTMQQRTRSVYFVPKLVCDLFVDHQDRLHNYIITMNKAKQKKKKCALFWAFMPQIYIKTFLIVFLVHLLLSIYGVFFISTCCNAVYLWNCDASLLLKKYLLTSVQFYYRFFLDQLSSMLKTKGRGRFI